MNSKKYGKNPKNVNFNPKVDKKFLDLTSRGKPPGGSYKPFEKPPKGGFYYPNGKKP